MATLEIEALDHIVLLCRDVETSLAWYRDRLGLEELRVDEWRAGNAPFPSLRITNDTIIDLFEAEPSGTNLDHLCVVVAPTDLGALVASGDFDVVSGPVTRWGARGNGTSVYVRDPDGNVVEIRYYGEYG
jgi:catechol 2,3-dioxygenase-like lactoylglutathione lyase family enzyme